MTTNANRRVTNAEVLGEVEKLSKILLGNGQVGLCEQVRVLDKAHADHVTEHKAAMAEQKEEIKTRKEFWNKVWLAAIGMVVTNVGVIVTAVVMMRMGLK